MFIYILYKDKKYIFNLTYNFQKKNTKRKQAK